MTAGHIRKLGVVALISITYFNVCGGPASVEIMSSMGPLLGFIGLIVMPCVWSIPLALVTCELSTAFPDNGGYGLWVSEAYGEFWGFMESYWSWVSIVVDSALYPVLAFKIATLPFTQNGQELSWGLSYAIKLAFTFIWTVPNVLGMQLVGSGLLVMLVLVLIPFILFSIWCLLYFNINNLLVVQPGVPPVIIGNPWLNLITNLFWNFSGFDCISTVAGEIHEPKKTLPRALLGSLVLVILSYFFPLVFAAAAAKPPASEWSQAGFWSIIAQNVGGNWLCYSIIFASFLGNMGLFIAKMFENSWQLQGMAEAGVIPKIFATLHPRFGSPYVATLLSFSIISILVSFDFDFIITIDTTFNCAAALLEMFAFFSLRFSQPNLIRPFTIPIQSKVGLILFLLFPTFTGCFVLFNGFFETVDTAVVNIVATFFGFGLYTILSKCGYISYKYKRIPGLEDSESNDEHISPTSSSDEENSNLKRGLSRSDSKPKEFLRSNSRDEQKVYHRMNSRDDKILLRFPSREVDKIRSPTGVEVVNLPTMLE